jgi:hypothetical protein
VQPESSNRTPSARFVDIQALLPDELADALTPAVYLEEHQFKLEKAKQRLADRWERKDIEATIQANRQLVHEEKAKLDLLSEGPIKANIVGSKLARLSSWHNFKNAMPSWIWNTRS